MIVKATNVRIVFNIKWYDGKGATSSYIGQEWLVPVDTLDDPLRTQVMLLVQQYAEQVKEPGAAKSSPTGRLHPNEPEMQNAPPLC